MEEGSSPAEKREQRKKERKKGGSSCSRRASSTSCCCSSSSPRKEVESVSPLVPREKERERERTLFDYTEGEVRERERERKGRPHMESKKEKVNPVEVRPSSDRWLPKKKERLFWKLGSKGKKERNFRREQSKNFSPNIYEEMTSF